MLVPAWQVPDEPSHFAYAQSLATRFSLPGDRHRSTYSHAQLLADRAVGASRGAFYPAATSPPWRRTDYVAYQRALRHGVLSSDGGGPNSASVNPPLYYLYADVAYWIADAGSNAFAELYAMRISSILLLLLTTTSTWYLAGEVFGPRRHAQLAAAAVVGLLPSETFISSSVQPDALMVALWSVALWLGARVIVRCGPRRDSTVLGLVVAGAVLTKATSYALVPAALLALLMGWLRQQSPRRGMISQFGGPVAALCVPISAWLGFAAAAGRSAINTVQTTAASHPFNVRQFLSYLWQFYFPRLPFLTLFRETPGLPLYDLWIREGWGVFGWRNVGFAPTIYAVLSAVTGAVALSATFVLTRLRGRLELALIVFFGLAVIALLAGLHLTDYRAIVAGQPAVIQGRYLLPVVSLFGLAVGLILTRLPARWQPSGSGVVLALMLSLQILALATVARTYYT